jgi:hypothetical protein
MTVRTAVQQTGHSAGQPLALSRLLRAPKVPGLPGKASGRPGTFGELKRVLTDAATKTVAGLKHPSGVLWCWSGIGCGHGRWLP